MWRKHNCRADGAHLVLGHCCAATEPGEAIRHRIAGVVIRRRESRQHQNGYAQGSAPHHTPCSQREDNNLIERDDRQTEDRRAARGHRHTRGHTGGGGEVFGRAPQARFSVIRPDDAHAATAFAHSMVAPPSAMEALATSTCTMEITGSPLAMQPFTCCRHTAGRRHSTWAILCA